MEHEALLGTEIDCTGEGLDGRLSGCVDAASLTDHGQMVSHRSSFSSR